MIIRKSLKEDVKDIMKIINRAKEFLKENGVDQWQDGYPNNETIESDILNNDSYVVLKDNNIVATLAISFDGEKTYDVIYDGKWLSNGKYAVIHRIAIDNEYRGTGVSSYILQKVYEICLDNNIHSIKIDTHEKNIPMQKLLKKNDFKYCGVIYLEDNSKRIAFEKVF
ncbi:GNAT superfamily N-acetyltransferase [Clostridium moniliforme]|uniref:GNAT superfamily N-acetyltransferase n=1 Tax=Clostridium moniliforme TaxID=39489 RepID=A0ABS4EZB6_9CLOT|nr:GNAT family N-acetyltransferase [Clostridium moniliforme]MBP1889346.1 GNAT superfamily N-acetyltransferase [Clostridium moniliforme]